MDPRAVGKGDRNSTVVLASPEGLRRAREFLILSSCLGGMYVKLGKDCYISYINLLHRRI